CANGAWGDIDYW
nr:immunoglobulin heavy chain junction region [Macaca mulatta]MOW75128.1 immunoglobulin heavy chain junction region [Macaca mulatta]MOW75198.1 immunoglobulin heavy chain junction region [Macaca mulatta]MOW75229.1 immunoglobulin heavy chain junction region [Macaca mulatta]MOW75237.1 immunoglobulin heavy chain junction region [Macaca mulatta]